MASLLQRSKSSIITRGLSTKAASPVKPNQSRNASKQSIPNPEKSNDNVGLPGFSLKNLEMSPGVKVVVYGALAVIGTAETITYGSWAYHKMKPDEDAKE